MDELVKIQLTPREYQIELLEKAKKQNSIVLLATGSGKTFIAAMLIKELSDQVRIPYEEGGKRSLFLVGNVYLVMQQAENIRIHTGLTVGEYYGEKMCDMWTKERWRQELEEHQVLVMTAQICAMFLDHGFFDICRANLMIFDECHKVVKNHPFSRIMDRYHESAAHQHREGAADARVELPRILGLTPSLINENKVIEKGLRNAISKLERKLDAKVMTASNRILVHRTKPKKHTVPCQKWNEKNAEEQLAKIRQILSETSSFLGASQNEVDDGTISFIRESFSRAQIVLEQLGPWCCLQTAKRLAAKLCRYLESKRHSTEEELRFIVLGQTQLALVMTILQRVMKGKEDNLIAVMKHWLPDRLRQTLVILEQCRKTFGDEFSGLIFVEQRYIAVALKESIEAIVQLLKYKALDHLRVEYVVGSNSPNVSDQPLGISPFKRLKLVMHDFRQKAFNLLVATNVLEEGVDVPHCNCVIHFDPPKNFTSYIQAQGRARKANSVYYVLIENDSLDTFERKLACYDEVETEIYNPCNYSKSISVREKFDNAWADILHPPYFPPMEGEETMCGRPRASMLNSVDIVNRYCANLPCDTFTRLVTKYSVSALPQHSPSGQTQSLYQGCLTLPLNSPVKETISGKPMPSIRYARMSTAIEVVRTLFEKGELDCHLLPVRGRALESYLLDEPAECDERAILAPSSGPPGTKQRRHYYPRGVASLLKEASPKPGEETFLYTITFCDATTNDASERSWGILSSKSMPKLPKFPLYNASGHYEFDVGIERITALPGFSQEDLQLLSELNHLLFSNVLKIRHDALKYDSKSAQLFIVPVRKDPICGYSVDTAFAKFAISEASRLNSQPTDSERLMFAFDSEKYNDTVVAPWHRTQCGDEVYVVTEIRRDLSPLSVFPDSSVPTFVDYFRQRYGIRIYDCQQPLLEFSGKGLKAIVPNYHNLKRRRIQSENERADGFPDIANQHSGTTLGKDTNGGTRLRQMFVPELVRVHPIPASMWKALTAIPFILHRLNTLLLAAEWSTMVERQAFLRNSAEFGSDFSAIEDYSAEGGFRRFDGDPISHVDDSDDDDDEDGFTEIGGAIADAPTGFVDDKDDIEECTGPDQPSVLHTVEDVFSHSPPIPSGTVECRFDKDHFSRYPQGPPLTSVLAALTLLCADDGLNLERLETVGDSFLKFAVSEYLYNAFDEFHEGKLTSLKSCLISNRNLFRLGINRRLTDFMTADKFQPYENWTPPGYHWVSADDGSNNLQQTHQLISDKSVADCVEATIGVYVLTYGGKQALEYLKWLGIGVKPKKGDEGIDLWSKPTRCPLLHFIDEPESQLRLLWKRFGLKGFERQLGYEFKEKAFLLQAVTHPSCDKNRVTDCYQPLEFLGDAILDYLITRVLFEDSREFGPCLLTDLRSALVNNTMFAALAVKHKFYEYLQALCPLLSRLVYEFVLIQEMKPSEANFNDMLCLVTEDENSVMEVEVPKALGDIFESVAAAVYLDSGGSLDTVWSVYYPMLKDVIVSCCADPPMSPIRQLMEKFPTQVSFTKPGAKNGKNAVAVRIAGFDKVFIGVGRNLRCAKNTAAKLALKHFIVPVVSADLAEDS